MLTFHKLNKFFKIRNHINFVLKDIDIEFKKGEFISIVGQSGSGKTTFLNIVGGLDNDFEGEYIINGINTHTFSSTAWDEFRKNKIGIIFQNFHLISHFTVLENIELTLTVEGINKKERTEKAKEMLKRVGLENHMDKKPDFLSGGEQQRVAIARALVKDPDIILADEPTGELDSETAKEILDLIHSLTKDKLVIMATHNIELANGYSSRIIQLVDGRMIEERKTVKNAISDTTEKTEPSVFKVKNQDLFYIALKNVYSNKRLSLLLLLVMILGISAFLLIIGTATAVKYQTNDLLNEYYEVNKFTFSTNPQGTLYKDYEEDFKEIDSVKNVYLQTILYPAFDYQENSNPDDAFLNGRGITGNLELLAISIDPNSSFGDNIAAGTYPANPYEILIGRITAKNLLIQYSERNGISDIDVERMNDRELLDSIKDIDIAYFTSHKLSSENRFPVGNKYYQVFPFSIKISGIIDDDKFYTTLMEKNKTEGPLFYNPRIYITNSLYCDILNQYNDRPFGTDVTEYHKVFSIIIELSSDDYQTRQKVIKEMLKIDKSFNYFLDPIDEFYDNLHRFSLFLLGVGIVFGIIVFFLSALISGSLISKSLEKRKKEFGILFSLGLSKHHLKLLLCYESFILSIIGILSSIGVFYLFRIMIKTRLNDLLFHIYQINQFPSYNPVTLPWYIIIISFILVLFAYLNPMRKFNHLSIVDALRDE